MLFRGKRNIHEDIQMKITNFADLLMVRENNSRIGFDSRVYYMFQDNWNLARFQRSGTCEIQESEGTSVQESWWVMIFGKNASRIWEEAKSKMSLQKFGLEV
jgi:hypothetical protein